MARRYQRQGPSLKDVVLPSLRRASHYATNEAIEDAKKTTRSTIRNVRLGGLANAIGSTSSLKKRKTGPSQSAYGVIFARGGEFSRANQALMSYTEGARITPGPGKKWLAYPTKQAGRLVRLPIPRTAGRKYANFKNQPSRGPKLRFVKFSERKAALVLDDASVSNKTGKAKPMRKRLGRGAKRYKFVIMFWLIRYTTRAARFNQHRIVAQSGQKIGNYVEQFQARTP
jgi:hypothetical protein